MYGHDMKELWHWTYEEENTIRLYFLNTKSQFLLFLEYLRALLPVPTIPHSLRDTLFRGFIYS